MSATIRHTINDSGDSVLLKLGELVSIRVAPGQMVRCRSGSVWITVDNGGPDHVLDCGQPLPPPARGRLVVWGLMAQREGFFLQYKKKKKKAHMKNINKNPPPGGKRKKCEGG